MRGSTNDTAPALDIPQATIHWVEAGGMTIESGTVRARIDLAPYLAGLPDNRCQCPHWGFVKKGQMTFTTRDGVETIRAGDFYYMAPGHSPVMEAGLEYIEYSPTAELQKSIDIVNANMERLGLPF